jgi:hypothetical protein
VLVLNVEDARQAEIFFACRVQIGGLIGRYSPVELMNLRVAYDAAGEAIGAGASVLGAASGVGSVIAAAL